MDVAEPSSDSPQLPTEFAHDICQSKSGQGEFLLFLNELFFFACLIFMLFVQQLLSACDIKMVVLPNTCPWVPEGKDVRRGARKLFN